MVQVSVSVACRSSLSSSRILKNTSSSVGSCLENPVGSIPLSLSRMNMSAISATEPVVATTSLRVGPADLVLLAECVAAPQPGRSSSLNSSSTSPVGTVAFSSSGVPLATILPPWRMAIWSARRSASSRYWVVRKTVVPLSTSCRMVSHMSVRLLGSSPVVGSSKKMIGAVADQAHGDVEPAPHPAREGQQAAVGGLVEVELVEQVRGGLPGIGDVAQLAHQHQVLPGGEHVVDRGELSGQADLLADLGGLLRHVEPGDARRAAVGVDQRGQDVDRGRLARAVGSEQGEDRAPPDGERHVVEHRYSLVSLHEVPHLDGVSASVHGPPVIVGEFAGNAQRLAVGFPVLFQVRQSRHQEVGERSPLQQHRPPFKRFVGQQRQAFAGEIALLAILGHVEAHGSGASDVDANAVHPLARSARATDQVEVVQGADRAGDRTSAGEQGLGQLRDALLPRVADRQVAEQSANHRRHAVAAGVETTGVVGERDLGISRHPNEITLITEKTQICVI